MATSAFSDRGPTPRSRVRAGNAYFYWASVVLLAFVLVGFAPTLYLRAFFAVEPIPAYLYLHGAVLTAWYGWLVVQTSLVRRRKTDLHRRTGWWGAAIGVAVCFAGPMATFGVVGRLRSRLGWTDDMSANPAVGVEGVRMIDFIAQVFWGNLFSIIAFAILVGWGIAWRSKAEWHKRLVLLGSFGLVGPALARISRWPVLGGEDGLFIPIVMLALPLSLVAHDLFVRRKVHKATLAGVGLLVAMTIVQQAVAGSQWGQATVKLFG